MDLFTFTVHFDNEEACRLHFREQRDKIGMACKGGHTQHYWIRSRWSYEDFVELGMPEKSDRNTTMEALKWVRITLSKAKRNLLGTTIKGKYLQLYLNELVYKLNRKVHRRKALRQVGRGQYYVAMTKNRYSKFI